VQRLLSRVRVGAGAMKCVEAHMPAAGPSVTSDRRRVRGLASPARPAGSSAVPTLGPRSPYLVFCVYSVGTHRMPGLKHPTEVKLAIASGAAARFAASKQSAA
jgi:hypothetical protein